MRNLIMKKTLELVELKLREYPVSKRKIANFEREKEEIAGALGSPLEHLGEIVKGEGEHGDPTYVQAMKLLKISGQIQDIQWDVKAIEDVLATLPPLDRKMVEMKYFQDIFKDQGIMIELGISRNKFYRKKKEILVKFARRMGLFA